MTLGEVKRYFNHWKRYPRLNALVAGCAQALGMELPDPDVGKRQSQYLTAEEFGRVVEQYGSAKTQGAGPRRG